MSSIEIRPLAVDERKAASNTVRAALLAAPPTDELLAKRTGMFDEIDAVAAWDGEQCVGHVGAFRFRMTVPGGERVATAGYTGVGVLATHTRRGLLRRMMEHTLHDARDRGQPIAILRASETPIYGRYGFALATDEIAGTITTALARPLRGEVVPGTVEIVDHDDLHATIPDVYDRCAAARVGMVDRAAWIWEVDLEHIAEPTSDRTAPAQVAAVHRDADGVADAYVIYQAEWDEGFADSPTASGQIRELFGTTGAAERAIWTYLLDIDLVRRWRFDRRPAGDPIRRAFHDVRAYESRQRLDELWLRLVDVDAALRARTYGPAAGAVVIEVADAFFADNGGRWAVSSAGAERTDRAADVSVDVATLSAAYLGAVAWSDLLASGELTSGVAGDVVTRLDALFASSPTPFCGTDF